MRTAINCLTHLHERITVHVELKKNILLHFYYYILQDELILKMLII